MTWDEASELFTEGKAKKLNDITFKVFGEKDEKTLTLSEAQQAYYHYREYLWYSDFINNTIMDINEKYPDYKFTKEKIMSNFEIYKDNLHYMRPGEKENQKILDEIHNDMLIEVQTELLKRKDSKARKPGQPQKTPVRGKNKTNTLQM